MNALEILNKFIDSGSPPDHLSREWPDGDDPVIHFAWFCGTRVNLPYDSKIYDAVWNRFQGFWREVNHEPGRSNSTIQEVSVASPI